MVVGNRNHFCFGRSAPCAATTGMKYVKKFLAAAISLRSHGIWNAAKIFNKCTAAL